MATGPNQVVNDDRVDALPTANDHARHPSAMPAITATNAARRPMRPRRPVMRAAPRANPTAAAARPR